MSRIIIEVADLEKKPLEEVITEVTAAITAIWNMAQKPETRTKAVEYSQYDDGSVEAGTISNEDAERQMQAMRAVEKLRRDDCDCPGCTRRREVMQKARNN